MKHQSAAVIEVTEPTEAEIRELAHLLYVQSGWIHGRDLDNWLEAEAFLRNRIAAEKAVVHHLRKSA